MIRLNKMTHVIRSVIICNKAATGKANKPTHADCRNCVTLPSYETEFQVQPERLPDSTGMFCIEFGKIS